MADTTKLITLAQLKLLAMDSASQVSELAGLVAEGLEEAAHLGITVTLPAASWSDKAQTIQNDSLLADSSYWYYVGCDADCRTAYSSAGVMADNVTTDGQITFSCEETPESDLTVHILRLEVTV